MAGTLAGTIQGEGGNSQADMFAVAATIWNRMKAGTFPGGSDPLAIVNAPQQFVSPSSVTGGSFAQTLANAINNGTLPQYGDVGNAVNFQSDTPTFSANTKAPGGTNSIGGNYFSDNFGVPTSDYRAPVLGGVNSDGSNYTASGDNNMGYPALGIKGSTTGTMGSGTNAYPALTQGQDYVNPSTWQQELAKATQSSGNVISAGSEKAAATTADATNKQTAADIGIIGSAETFLTKAFVVTALAVLGIVIVAFGLGLFNKKMVAGMIT